MPAVLIVFMETPSIIIALLKTTVSTSLCERLKTKLADISLLPMWSWSGLPSQSSSMQQLSQIVNSLINGFFRLSSLFLCMILMRKALRDPVIPWPIIHPCQSLFSSKSQLTQETLIFAFVSHFALSHFFAAIVLSLNCSRPCCVKWWGHWTWTGVSLEVDSESRSCCDGAGESILVQQGVEEFSQSYLGSLPSLCLKFGCW